MRDSDFSRIDRVLGSWLVYLAKTRSREIQLVQLKHLKKSNYEIESYENELKKMIPNFDRDHLLLIG